MLSARPGLDSGGQRLTAFGLIIQVMGGALDEHAPPVPADRAEVVDFEGHPVFRTFKPGAQFGGREAVGDVRKRIAPL